MTLSVDPRIELTRDTYKYTIISTPICVRVGSVPNRGKSLRKETF